ncbi:MAG TPA: chaperonin GroEL [Patescibacteria group bacterium]
MIHHLEQDKVKETIKNAVNALVDYVKVTFGPSGFKVILPPEFAAKPQALDDGVAIAKKFTLENEHENAVIELIKQVAIKTNDRVGDGTTGSLIMLQAILNEVDALGAINPRLVVSELKKAAAEAKDKLILASKKVKTLEDLQKVAQISIDNAQISKIIAELVHKIGHEGVIAVQESQTMETTHEHVDGFEFEKGYVAPFMVTNPERMEAEFSNAKIFITDYRLTTAIDMVQILEKLVKEGVTQCVFVAEAIESDALTTLLANRQRGVFYPIAVNVPGYDDKDDFLNDLAVVTGGQVLSRSKDIRIEDFDIKMLGKADKIVSKADSTLIIGGKGKKSEINKVAAGIKVLMENALGYKLDRLQRRYGRLMNGIAVIRVGAPTEQEMHALRYKVEDATNAVKVAAESGIVCGGGLSLARLKTKSNLLNKALMAPYMQLLENSNVSAPDLKKDEALNIVTGEIGDFLKVGVVDPTAVLIAQIESAVSMACELILIRGILADCKEKQYVEMAPRPY